jgi:hypothetical protein
MNRRFMRFIVFVALFLLTNVGAEAQWRSSARPVNKQVYRSPIQEIARNNPQAVEKLRKRLGLTQPSQAFLNANKAKDSERVGAELRGQLKELGLTLKVDEQGQQSILTIEPEKRTDAPKTFGWISLRRRENEVLGRAWLAIERREEILSKMHVKEVRPLEAFRRGSKTKSELEAHLKSIGVTDYERVAASFDGNAQTMAFTFSKDVELLRIFGGESEPIGRYMFCCLQGPKSAPVAMKEFTHAGRFVWADATGLALPPGNLENALAKVTVPAGTAAVIGTVADNFRDTKGNPLPGGNNQIFLPHVKGVDWKWTSYHFAGASSSPSDIILEFPENKMVRFRPSSSPDGTVRDR